MASLTFARPEFLALLLAAPLIVLAHWWLLRYTKRKGMRFANFETLKRVTGEKVLTKNVTVLVLRVAAFCLIAVALAQPAVWYHGDRQASDYVLAIDTSGSMTATDLEPSRFEAARDAALRFIDVVNDTAGIGVISFSGVVNVEQPLTEDPVLARKGVEKIAIKTISGTDMGGALVTGTNLLLPSEKGRVLILFSDGSSTAGTFIEDPVMNGVEYAKERGVVVHTIGMGDTSGAIAGYLPRLYNVSAVYSAETLQYIANQTGGEFYEARDDAQLEAVFGALQTDSESTLQTTDLSAHALLLALVLLFAEWGLMNTRFRFIP